MVGLDVRTEAAAAGGGGGGVGAGWDLSAVAGAGPGLGGGRSSDPGSVRGGGGRSRRQSQGRPCPEGLRGAAGRIEGTPPTHTTRLTFPLHGWEGGTGQGAGFYQLPRPHHTKAPGWDSGAAGLFSEQGAWGRREPQAG